MLRQNYLVNKFPDRRVQIQLISISNRQLQLQTKPIFLMVNIQDNPLYYAAAGGVIIGIATSINYAFRGSVTGMSGMLYSTVSLDKNDMPKNIGIIGGMLLIAGIFFDIFQYGTFNKFTPFGPQANITIYTSQLGFALAGILVGFGTKLSNGCTSGHGLCGLARFSIRSIVAVVSFLISGLAISTIILYAGGLGPFTENRYSPKITYDHLISANICIAIGVVLPLIGLYMRVRAANQSAEELRQINGENSTSTEIKEQKASSNSFIYKDQFVLFFVGFIFGLGLLVSGMVRRSNIINFLALGKDWNPSLLFVLGCGLAVNLIFFTYMLKVRKQPIFGGKLFNPNNNVIDIRLVGGAICFGLGWGIGGLCPGPSIMQSSVFTIDVHLIWFPFFFLGQFIANKLNEVFPPEGSTPNKQTQKVQVNANQMIEKSQIMAKMNPGQNQVYGIQNTTNFGKILHQQGPGYSHANKLPSLPTAVTQQVIDTNGVRISPSPIQQKVVIQYYH